MNIDELLAALGALRVTVAEAMKDIDAMASALEAQKATPRSLADVHVSIHVHPRAGTAYTTVAMMATASL